MKISLPRHTCSLLIYSCILFSGFAQANGEADLASVAETETAPAQNAKNAASEAEPLRPEPLRQLHVQYGVFNHHFFPSPVQVNRNNMLNLEWTFATYPDWGHWTRLGADHALWGGAVLRNSFGQPTQYLYVGQQWNLNKNLYFKLTGGLLHGYKDPYQNKIPFNHYGTAPVIVPSIGLSLGRAIIETIFLSNRSVMIAVGVRF